MPQRTSKACLKCGQPTDGRSYYCPSHTKNKDQYYDRATPAERGYDNEWAAFSKRYLNLYPECKRCGKRAKYVHHIKKLSDHPHLKYVMANLEGLCIACHGIKHRTKRENN